MIETADRAMQEKGVVRAGRGSLYIS